MRTAHFLKSVCLEIGTGGVERHLVDELARVEPGDEDEAARRQVAAAGLDAGQHLAAARDDPDRRAAAQAELGGVVGVHVAEGVGHGAEELGHALGHRAGVPVLEHAAGGEPEGIFLVRALGGRLVGEREDHGAAVLLAVEVELLLALGVGVVVAVEAPARLLALDHRPAQAAHLVVAVEGREVVAVAAAEARVFLEEALLDVEAEDVGLGVGIFLVDVGALVGVDLAVGEEDVVEGLAGKVGGDELGRPDLLDGEALGELDELPEVGLRLAGGVDHLPPELGAPLGVAVGALLLDPHRGGQDQVGGLAGGGRVDVGDDDEVLRVAVAGQPLLHQVRGGLDVVVHLHPVDVDLAVLEVAVLLHGVRADPVGDGARRQLPDLLGVRPVLGVRHLQVGRQAVGEGADLAGGAAGRGLAGQREGRVAGLGDLSGQEVQVVDEVVRPGAAGVLVEAHGPERHHLDVRVGVELGERLAGATPPPRSSRRSSSACRARRTWRSPRS